MLKNVFLNFTPYYNRYIAFIPYNLLTCTLWDPLQLFESLPLPLAEHLWRYGLYPDLIPQSSSLIYPPINAKYISVSIVIWDKIQKIRFFSI